MAFQIIRNDITKVKADAVVNTANPEPVIGRGTDQAVYVAAGAEKLLAERRKIGRIEPGKAAATPAFSLPAKHIIHTEGPVWVDGTHKEEETLHSCYRESLLLAEKLGCESIAFPLISSGNYGFPKGKALDAALEEIGKFLLTHEMTVILVVFDAGSVELSETLVGEIERFISEHGAETIRKQEYEDALPPGMTAREEERMMLRAREERRARAFRNGRQKSLEEAVGAPGKTFRERLFELIDESGMDDVTVYKKANIDRKVFSRIRSKKDYTPTKKTAIAFAIALELDLPTMIDLLSRAGIALSPGNRFDLIITYFFTRKIYDIFEINAALFRYGEPVLGE